MNRFAIAAIALALAALADGCSPPAQTAVIPAAAPPVAPPKVEAAELPQVKFVDVTEQAGLKFVHENAAEGAKLLPETMGSGCAFLDYDGDGDQDLFLVNQAPWPTAEGADPASRPRQALYRNDGTGKFEDVARSVGVDLDFFGQGVAVGDYDNDGDPDLFLTGLDGCRLLRNEGGTFNDVTGPAGAGLGKGWWTSAAFFDLENDGDLDLFVCNYIDWTADYDRAQDFQLKGTGQGRAYGPPSSFNGSSCALLRNDGGTFVEIGEEAGIRVKSPELGLPMAKALGVAPYDVDGDGLVDLAVANDTVRNFLFRNLGGGKFEEVGMTSGVAFDQSGSVRGAMGIDWAHFKGDGALGLCIGNFANEMTALYVTDAPADWQFNDLANLFGLGAPTQPPLKFGLFFFDYDLDGRPDLLLANGHLESDIAQVQASETYEQPAQLYWNSGRAGRSLFVQVGPESAGPDLFRPIVGRGSSYADIDGDGDLDVVITANGQAARLLRNDGGDANNWVRLKLVGAKSNRDGIGARVALMAGGREQRRQLVPAKGYLSSVELPLTFGLGGSTQADSVTITWPSGVVDELKGLDAGKTYVVAEGQGVRP